MDGVAISIIGRPRPLPGHDTPNPAHNTYTLKCEEPVNLCTEFCQVYRVVVVVAGCLSGYCHLTRNRLSGLLRMAVISVAVR